MIYVAEIKDGTVIQVTVELDGFQPSESQAVIGPENTVGIGWSYSDGAFIPPDFTEE